MAKAKKQIPKDANVEVVPLVGYARNAMAVFGSYSLEDRAVPDWRDGLKPVHRRVLWAAYKLGIHSKAKHRKSAKLVGDTMGDYHPHGDAPIYDTAVRMASNLAHPLIDGLGNFGTLVDSPAAMRYTEARLTQLAELIFFNPDYTHPDVIEMVPNFDGSAIEPLILPSLLPHILLNGSYGIAVGATTSVMAFDLEGVAELTKMALSGKKITPRIAGRFLIPMCGEGGEAYLETYDGYDYSQGVSDYIQTGEGWVYWNPSAEYDIENRQVRLNGFQPTTIRGVTKCVESVAKDPSVAEVVDDSDLDDNNKGELAYIVRLRGDIAKRDVEGELYRIVDEHFSGNQNYVFNVTTRTAEELTASTFERVSVLSCLEKWVKWRIELERRSIKHKLAKRKVRLEHQELMLLAVLNRDVIIKALDADDSAAVIQKALKITLEQANAILELKVRQLKALEEKPVRQRIKELKAEIAQLNKDHKTPAPRIIAGIDEILENLEG